MSTDAYPEDWPCHKPECLPGMVVLGVWGLVLGVVGTLLVLG